MASGSSVKIAVIGAGSIGSKHARILQDLQHDVVSISSHAEPGKYHTIADALKHEQFEYVIIASKTSQHNSDLHKLYDSKFSGKVLVEKPLFASFEKLGANTFSVAAVGYNLRFHPAIKWLRANLLSLGEISSANFYVGQYLPTWRKSINYQTSSSASTDAGGGVLRDLSHELDLAQLMFGDWHQLTAIGGKFSDLEIETADTFSVLMNSSHCPAVSIQLNYLDRVSQRSITVNGNNGTISLDLISGVAKYNDSTEIFKSEPDQTYSDQHKAIIAGDKDDLCTFDNALTVVKTIEAIESASNKHEWIKK